MQNYKMIDDEYVAHTYRRFNICFEYGKGSYLYDNKGKQYLDFTSGIGVNALGHAYPKWVEAIQKQCASLAHVSNLYYSEPMLQLAKTLVSMAKANKVFFANSGAEANEGAIKVARKYANKKYSGKRNEIITLVNSFHGRTITTLSATGQDHFHQDFEPFTTGFKHIEANNLEDLQNNVNDKTAAIMIEIVQGEGGVIPLQLDFVKKIQSICEQKDILLIVDEVQTGIGRCANLFAYEKFGLHPDIVTSAKGLGNGLAIGAILLYEKCADVLQYGEHGTTFGGNPIACAGAKIVLDTLTPSFLHDVSEKGIYLKERLLKLPHVKKVNGLGLMLGVELNGVVVGELIEQCNKQGVLFLSAKNNLRLLPPLTISIEEIDQGIQILKEVLEKWEN